MLDRLLELRVPDQITLDGDELVSLLEDGVAALAGRGVDVLWPRSLGRDLTATTVLDRATPMSEREAQLRTGMFGEDAAVQLPLAARRCTATRSPRRRWTSSPRRAAPLLRLRGNWTVIDPAIARKARKRVIRTVAPAEAVAAALTGVVQLGTADQPVEEQVVLGASLLKVRERLLQRRVTSRRSTYPPGCTARLRDYQRQGLTWLVELTSHGLGACLADDMGLGKTITLIALHLHRVEAGHTGPDAGGLPGQPARQLGAGAGAVRARAWPCAGSTAADARSTGSTDGFVLTTYGTMRVSHEELGEVGWDLVVADEAQHVKNARSSTAKALRTIESRVRVALTGTPMENNLTELWAILDWVIPGLLGSRQAFRRVWASPIEAGVHEAKTRQFADLIGPFLLRRRKSDPGIAPELPAKTETDHPLGLTREQVVLYESFVRDTMARIERAGHDDQVTRRGLVLALLTGLKQICNHPAHFLKESGAVRLTGRSEKLDLVDELLGTVLAEDGAALVFTQYVAMGRLLEAHLAKAGVPHQFLHGGTPVREREAMVARFQAGELRRCSCSRSRPAAPAST